MPLDYSYQHSQYLKSKSAKDYIRSRGISDQVSKEYLLGYEKLNSPSKLRGRVLFPLRDIDGSVVAIQGRALTPDIRPKYYHTSFTGSGIKSKQHYLYGLYEYIERGKRLPIVIQEGSLDVMTLAMFGVCAVCSWGSVLTDYQVWLMKFLTNTLYIGYDDDEAGRMATERALVVCADMKVEARLLTTPKYKDWTEHNEKEGKEQTRKALFKALRV